MESEIDWTNVFGILCIVLMVVVIFFAYNNLKQHYALKYIYAERLELKEQLASAELRLSQFQMYYDSNYFGSLNTSNQLLGVAFVGKGFFSVWVGNNTISFADIQETCYHEYLHLKEYNTGQGDHHKWN